MGSGRRESDGSNNVVMREGVKDCAGVGIPYFSVPDVQISGSLGTTPKGSRYSKRSIVTRLTR